MDAAVIAEFNLRLATETEGLHLDPETVLAGVKALLNDDSKGLYFVAECADEIAGQLMITREWSDWRNGNIWWLQSVYVHPKHRRAGVFTALYEDLRRRAAATKDVRCLRLYMHRTNQRAREAYCRVGMSRTEYEVFETEFGGESLPASNGLEARSAK